jgi:RNA polymerase sigma-70 factor (ECF subfamily)
MGEIAGTRAERFSSLYGAHYGQLHAYAARRVGAEAADEVVAEAFLIAWRRFDDLPDHALPWLYGVTRNVVLQHRVRSARHAAAQTALRRLPPPPSPDGDSGEVWTAWAALSVADQEVLALIAWEDLTVADAARVLGCSAPVFSVRLHRARRRLERRLANRVGTTKRPELSEVR